MSIHKLTAMSLIVLVLTAGCSSRRWMRPSECALIGTSLGVISGMTWAATDGDDNFRDWAAGIGVGALGGALAGYAFCWMVSSTGRRSASLERNPKIRLAESEVESETVLYTPLDRGQTTGSLACTSELITPLARWHATTLIR